MLILAWLNTLFNGNFQTHPTSEHDELGPALEVLRVQITGLFADIDAYLETSEIAEAEAGCRQLTLLLAQLPISQASAQSRHMLAAYLFDLASTYRIMRKKDGNRSSSGKQRRTG